MIKAYKSHSFEIWNIIESFYYRLKTRLYYRQYFKYIGSKCRVIRPLKITNPENISLGNRVTINKYSWLFSAMINEKKPELIFDDDVVIGHFNHITCVNKVHLGKSVLTADRVYISDNYHGYEDPNTPIINQPIRSKGEVDIGAGTWIGDNVSIISCTIGKQCVIGANSVVNKDIPDYSVAVGVPVRIVKRYNFATKTWEKTNAQGQFLTK